MTVEEQPFGEIKESLKRVAAALRDADVPFLLGGGLAAWAWGGPGTGHDLDVMVRPDEAERALEALASAGMRTERPPEGWLYKAWDGEVLVDIIFRPVGQAVDDELFERAEELEVNAVAMKVMSLEDILVTKLTPWTSMSSTTSATSSSPVRSASASTGRRSGAGRRNRPMRGRSSPSSKSSRSSNV